MYIETAIINALKAIDMPTDIIPVLSDRDGVEPRAPYLLINIISSVSVGLPRKSITSDKIKRTETVFQVKDILVSLTFHASTKGNTHDWVQRLDTGLQSDMFDWAFTQQGLGFVSSDGVMYQTQPVAGKNYKNAIMNLVFRTEVSDDFTVNQISRVKIDGNLEDSVLPEKPTVTITREYKP